jgi:hypothetical protein
MRSYRSQMFLRQQQYLNWLPSHGLLDFFPWHMLKVNNYGLLNVTATLKNNELQLPHLNDVISINVFLVCTESGKSME